MSGYYASKLGYDNWSPFYYWNTLESELNARARMHARTRTLNEKEIL